MSDHDLQTLPLVDSPGTAPAAPPVAPGSPAAGTRHPGAEGAPTEAEIKLAQDIARRAGSKGGKRPKPGSMVPVTGLSEHTPARITLATHADRLALLTAVAEALARGRCSSATATALIQVIKTADSLACAELEDAVERLVARVEELQRRVVR